MEFKLHAPYAPSGDQPGAIAGLTEGIQKGLQKQTLLGVTGSGKTFTAANVIQNVQKPTLVIAHNKTLAAQLCNEFREFFPENAVEYFVSYYDYYQPEAYLPRTDTYIEKDAQINDEIDRLRHSATQALLSRKDVIIVASVSCIYGLGSPKEYQNEVLHLEIGHQGRNDLMRRLIDMHFERTNADVGRGQFRATGDVIEVMTKSDESSMIRLVFEGDALAEIFELHPVTRKINQRLPDVWIFPAKHYVVGSDSMNRALKSIETELKDRLAQFEKEGKVLEAERLRRRTQYDLEMMRNIGYCSGIENYSRHFEGRPIGSPPDTLLSYFPDDFLLVIDESHVTIPQIRAMYAGDQARKNTLVEHGFRLPSAKDNRPLTFEEFNARVGQTIFVSATPSDYERDTSEQIVEQIVRPTGLVDPETLILPVTESEDHRGQVDDLIARIHERVGRGERTLVTTLTKKMAEDLTEHLKELGVKVQYLHSDVQTLDRIQVLTDLRKGVNDVIVGVNLLREGLDLPEVSLVAILDADKEGFLRSETSIIQTIGRAARNINGEVVLYADQMTGSLERALRETKRRRKIQIAYNKKHGITPKSVQKNVSDIRKILGHDPDEADVKEVLDIEMTVSAGDIERMIREKERDMKHAAADLRFETAALLRDELELLKKELKKK